MANRDYSTSAPDLDHLHWINRFARLPQTFYTRLAPQPVRQPRWVHTNAEVARWLGLAPSALTRDDSLLALAGNRAIKGAEPLATVYSGHQFGVWAGQLGDGRALLLGEVAGPAGTFEIQLKGSGLTPYSRMGDGRAVLRSSIREYLASIAMHGLHIPTTQVLALIAAEDPVQRETLESAAVVTRVAESFIRFGHFQHWAAAGDVDALRCLTEFVIDTYYPECRPKAEAAESDFEPTVLRWLQAVVRRTATLLAQWQAVGFMHGVMNTDNMSILGLTIDYGPYGFMDGFDANHICNHSDSAGRYAWNVQPAVAHWNLYRLAESLRPLVSGVEPLREVLNTFETHFTHAFQALLTQKFGLEQWHEDDQALVDDWWQLLHTQRVDMTLAFRRLGWLDVPAAQREQESPNDDPGEFLDLFYDTVSAGQWLTQYQRRLQAESRPASERRAQMRQSNPLYVLRNHLAESAIRLAQDGDFGEVERLAKVLREPFVGQPGAESYRALPPAWATDLAVSCSS